MAENTVPSESAEKTEEVRSSTDSLVSREHEMLRFWEDREIFKKLKVKNAGNKRFRFLDGPITANNPMGVHHAWGRTIKDIYLRYKAMRGFDCRYQNGFDSQGLWVEVGTEKELGFVTKKDIETYGIDRFTRKCEERVDKFAGIITEQSKRLGQWMDWENSYFTNTDVNIQGIWHFLKKCDEMGLIEQEYKPMPWCPRCGTSLSEHEMTGSYKQITHNSVFFKLPIKGMASKMLVWTTTPWTLSSNVALAVNPELDYAEVRVASDSDTIFLAKSAIKILGDDKQEVLRFVKGAELVGKEFETCFPEFEKQAGVEHKIVAWEDVAADEGTGVVHIAPGCGMEDFELGRRLGLAQIMPIDDIGVFLPGFGFMTGKDSHAVADEVFEELEKRGKLYKVVPYEHSYPVCWRCKSEVVFRLVPAWYIRTESLKPRLIKNAMSVKWEPESNGKRMIDWLTNMGDWNISRKRYYGMPLPFYPCDCGHVTVVGSKAELRELATDPAAVDALPELHRPWIDGVKIKCPHCGKEVSRINEIGDVWLDAGIVPFSTFGYFSDKEEWKKNYPAEWIVEMREQVRLWFYSMLFMSTVLEDRSPYERVLCNSAVVQENGEQFHKNGFMIKFDDAADRMGADTVRYLYAGAPVANDVRFGFGLGDEARRKLLGFYNIYTFLKTYSAIDKPSLDGFDPAAASFTTTDRWLILRVNEFIDRAGELYDDYKHYYLVKDFEALVDDISNWYIRVNRRRFWKAGDAADKTTAYWVLAYALRSATLVMSPIIPFMTEFIWRDLILTLWSDLPESVHLADWPEKYEGVTEDGVTEQTALAREVIAAAMKIRNESQIKVRQPLAKLFLCVPEEDAGKIAVFEENIKSELNIREIVFVADRGRLEDAYLTVNFKKAGAVLKGAVNNMKNALAALSGEEAAACAAAFDRGEDISVPGFDGAYAPDLFEKHTRTREGIAAAEFGTDGVIALDVVITPELKADGIVRDIVRRCQILRKEAGYEVDGRIDASITSADAEIMAAVTAQKDHIASELLCDELTLGADLPGADIRETAEAGDGEAVISLKAK
ncbi:MAG: isoleucine--tRNA ligase [Clostridia bacterium]|nr:isoleucine--tRNA ligase [Clostridia bacterium]